CKWYTTADDRGSPPYVVDPSPVQSGRSAPPRAAARPAPPPAPRRPPARRREGTNGTTFK
ncbi:hypothetical protein JYU34_022703, partial [Plutella xylostella]